MTTAYHQLHDQLHGELNDWFNKTNIWLIPDEATHGRPLVWPLQWPWWQCKYVMGILTWPSTCVATRASTCVATHASSNCPLLWASTCSKARASTCVITRASTCVVTRARLLFKNMPPGPSESPYPPPPDPRPLTPDHPTPDHSTQDHPSLALDSQRDCNLKEVKGGENQNESSFLHWILRILFTLHKIIALYSHVHLSVCEQAWHSYSDSKHSFPRTLSQSNILFLIQTLSSHNL